MVEKEQLEKPTSPFLESLLTQRQFLIIELQRIEELITIEQNRLFLLNKHEQIKD